MMIQQMTNCKQIMLVTSSNTLLMALAGGTYILASNVGVLMNIVDRYSQHRN